MALEKSAQEALVESTDDPAKGQFRIGISVPLPPLRKLFNNLLNKNGRIDNHEPPRPPQPWPDPVEPERPPETCAAISYKDIYDLSGLDNTTIIPETGLTARQFIEKQLIEMEKSPVAQGVFQKILDEGVVAKEKIKIATDTAIPHISGNTIFLNASDADAHFSYVNAAGEIVHFTTEDVLLHSTSRMQKSLGTSGTIIQLNTIDSLRELNLGSEQEKQELETLKTSYDAYAASVNKLIGEIITSHNKRENNFTGTIELNGYKYEFISTGGGRGANGNITITRGKIGSTEPMEIMSSEDLQYYQDQVNVSAQIERIKAVIENDYINLNATPNTAADYIFYRKMLEIKASEEINSNQNRAMDVTSVNAMLKGQEESDLRGGDINSIYFAPKPGEKTPYAKDYKSDHDPKDPKIPEYMKAYYARQDKAWNTYFAGDKEKSVRDNLGEVEKITTQDGFIDPKEKARLIEIANTLTGLGVKSSYSEENGCVSFKAEGMYQKKGMALG